MGNLDLLRVTPFLGVRRAIISKKMNPKFIGSTRFSRE